MIAVIHILNILALRTHGSYAEPDKGEKKIKKGEDGQIFSLHDINFVLKENVI